MINTTLVVTKVATAAAAPAFKAFCRELARQNAETAMIDFGSLDKEMDEAIDVLARDADGPGKALLDFVKGIISERPQIFNKPIAQQWIRTAKAQELIKLGVKALIYDQPIQHFADDATAFYESFNDATCEANGSDVFDYAVAFVALSITRDFTAGEKTILSAIKGLTKRFDDVMAPTSLSRDLLDVEVTKEIERIRRGRFFSGFYFPAETRALADRLIAGNLAGASDTVRSGAISMCVRWLSAKEDSSDLESMLMAASALSQTEEAVIATAFIAARKDWKQGLSALNPLDSPTRRTAALQIVLNHQGTLKAIDWLRAASFAPNDLDSDGRFVRLTCYIQEEEWQDAFNEVPTIPEQDFIKTPALQFTAAMIRMARVVPEDLRTRLLQGTPPLDARSFPLADDEQALAERRASIRLMQGAAHSALEFGCEAAAKLCANFVLWLELRDPSTEAAAKTRLNELLSDGGQAIAYIPLGLSFGVPLNFDMVEKALARDTAFLPNGSVEIALARLTLALSRKNEIECADYFARHRELIFRHLDPANITRIEVELLVAAGRSEQARGCIIESETLLDDEERKQLEAVIESGADGPSTADLEAVYAQTPSTINLAHLVAHLSHQGYSSRFHELASKLVRTTRTRADAEKVMHVLLKLDRHDELADLLSGIPEIVETSLDLRSSWAWSCYRRGQLKEAGEIVNALLAERDDSNDRTLLVNILISSGRWHELPSFIEGEWASHERRTPGELLIAAQLAAQVGSARLDELLEAAAAQDDPHVLVGCYLTAVQSGREDRPSVYRWFERATMLSGEEGPVKSASLAELVDQVPDWNRHVDDIWDKLRLGVAPLSIAARLLRRPSLELQLSPMIANRLQPDPRRRIVVPTFSGTRADTLLGASSIALDGSSLVTLGVLDLVGAVTQSNQGVYIPHCTLGWLFGERQKLGFHQPSRTKAAHVMARALAGKRLHRFTSALPPDPVLSELIGQPLSTMLATAMALSDDGVQRLVVRSAPVHKLGSFLGEAVELDEFYSALCSCTAVIDKLAERGQLTQDEEERARGYLKQHEECWPNEPVIADGAQLYLDDLSVSYLRTAGVLEKLHAAGLDVYISDWEIGEAEALIELESRAEAIESVIEHIREALAAGIERGYVHVDRMFAREELEAHPNLAVIELAGRVDAIISDDRYINQHRTMESESGTSAIWSSLDLLAALQSKSALTIDDCWRHRTTLRQSGVIHIPSSVEEMTSLITRSRTRDGRMIETGELRAFRENLELAQMRGWINLPHESTWLDKLVSDLLEVIRAQWTDDVPDKEARIRSQWLLERADMRNWAGQVTDNDGINMARYGLVAPVNSLLLNHANRLSEDGANRLADWLRDDVVSAIKYEDPTVYSWLIASLQSVISIRVDEEGIINAG